MIRLAGRPVLGHILHNLAGSRVEEVAIVVGSGELQDQIVEYATSAFGDRFEFAFPVQASPEGLGHSVYQARSVVDGDPVLIALADMIFEQSYERFVEHHRNGDADGSIGIKRVDQPRHHGIVEERDGEVVSLVEKPADPPSNKAISGAYVIEDTDALFGALQYLITNDVRSAGEEYQLTDALARMVERGATLETFPVEEWHDCGRPDTLLETNRALMDGNGVPRKFETAVVVPPVDVGEDVRIERSVVGPYVSVDGGSEILDSRVQDTIVGRDSRVERANLTHSIVGTRSVVEGSSRELNVGDSSELSL
jgi:glucose-1-phosphate thymidylyltransferase